MPEDLVFVDRLPPDMAPRRRTKYEDIAAQLRKNPRRWALIRDDCEVRKTAQETGYHIQNGKTLAFRPAGAFEARAVTSEAGVHQVWARYIGGDAS